MAEFALVATVAMMLLFAAVAFGQCLFAYDLVQDAARQGSRYAMVRGTSCNAADCPATASQVQNYVRGVSAGIVPGSMTVTTAWTSGAGCTAAPYQGPGCLVTVKVQYPFLFVSPLVPKLSWTMSSTSEMTISQ